VVAMAYTNFIDDGWFRTWQLEACLFIDALILHAEAVGVGTAPVELANYLAEIGIPEGKLYADAHAYRVPAGSPNDLARAVFGQMARRDPAADIVPADAMHELLLSAGVLTDDLSLFPDCVDEPEVECDRHNQRAYRRWLKG
jgi:hypothetical protein